MGQVWSSRVVDVMERICRDGRGGGREDPARRAGADAARSLRHRRFAALAIVGSFLTVAPLLIATAKFGPAGPACWSWLAWRGASAS
jgi:hypothetical protein